MSALFLMMALWLCPACSSSSDNGTTQPNDSPSSEETVDSTAYRATGKDVSPTTYDGYSLVWHDEFDTDGRPGKEWKYEQGFQRNEELQWYQSDNASVSGGCLVIEGRKEQWKAIWNESVTPFSHFTGKDKDWAKKFHVWRMDWDESQMAIYVDGELVNKIDLSTTYNKGYDDNYENPFTSSEMKHYIILNLAIGSNGGTPDLSSFPLKYNVDYVRVYQKQ